MQFNLITKFLPMNFRCMVFLEVFNNVSSHFLLFHKMVYVKI